MNIDNLSIICILFLRAASGQKTLLRSGILEFSTYLISDTNSDPMSDKTVVLTGITTTEPLILGTILAPSDHPCSE